MLIDYFGLQDGPVDGIYGVGIDYAVDGHDSDRWGVYRLVVNADPYRFGDIPKWLYGVRIVTETHCEPPSGP